MLHVLTRVAEIHCGDIEASLEHTALRFGQGGNNLPSGNIVLPEFERPTRYTLAGRGMWVESAEHRTLSSCVRIVKIDMFPVDCSVETLSGGRAIGCRAQFVERNSEVAGLDEGAPDLPGHLRGLLEAISE